MPRYSTKLKLPFRLGGEYPDSVEVRRSDRKTVSLELRRDGVFFVRAPRKMEDARIIAFLKDREAWLRSHLKKQEEQRQNAADENGTPPGKLTGAELRLLAEQARDDLMTRAVRFAPMVGVSFGRVTIRCQKTRWGSCSSEGNLNFNCLLMLAPPEARDYVVIHELCHRLEMNHSPRFWAEVGRVCPDYRAQKRWFKENGGAILNRVFG